MPRPGDPVAISQTVWPSSPTGRQNTMPVRTGPGDECPPAPAGLRHRSEPAVTWPSLTRFTSRGHWGAPVGAGDRSAHALPAWAGGRRRPGR
jgi:hypothetical protein